MNETPLGDVELNDDVESGDEEEEDEESGESFSNAVGDSGSWLISFSVGGCKFFTVQNTLLDEP